MNHGPTLANAGDPAGYVPDDHPWFEAFIGRPFAHGMEYFEFYAQLVRRG